MVTMTNTDDSITWRDLSDQLTAEEIDSLEAYERDPGQTPAGLLNIARQWISENLGAALCADLPTPAGIELSEWQPDGDGWVRFFVVSRAGGVEVTGQQHGDGTVQHHVLVDTVEDLSAEQARALAAAILAAADHVDALAVEE